MNHDSRFNVMFYLLFLNGLRFKSVADLWSLQHTEKAGQENTASDVWVLKRSHVRGSTSGSGVNVPLACTHFLRVACSRG